MKDFRVEAGAQTEFKESASWYESQRWPGFKFIAEVDRVLVRIAHGEKFAGARIKLTTYDSALNHGVGRFRTWSFRRNERRTAG